MAVFPPAYLAANAVPRYASLGVTCSLRRDGDEGIGVLRFVAVDFRHHHAGFAFDVLPLDSELIVAFVCGIFVAFDRGRILPRQRETNVGLFGVAPDRVYVVRGFRMATADGIVGRGSFTCSTTR